MTYSFAKDYRKNIGYQAWTVYFNRPVKPDESTYYI